MSQELPVGSIIMYGGATSSNLPDNWKVCNGAALPLPQNSDSPYWDLFAAVDMGQLYGLNDTDFFLPDLRGLFVRAASGSTSIDPDKGSRKKWDGNTWNGQGEGIGTTQEDELKSHTHSYAVSTYYDSGNWSGDDWNNGPGTTGATGGNETRPKNMYMFYIIKVQ